MLCELLYTLIFYIVLPPNAEAEADGNIIPPLSTAASMLTTVDSGNQVM